MAEQHTPGPWKAIVETSYVEGQDCVFTTVDILPATAGPYRGDITRLQSCEHINGRTGAEVIANAHLIAAAPDLLAALEEGRRAIGDHYAPNDCYATGPLTGDHYRDLIECPACSFIEKYDAAIAKARGQV